MSYQAIVTAIRVRPHPGADRLLLGTCLGNQVVVGTDTADGELGVFFPTDGQLSHEYCLYNDLYTKSARERLELPPSDSPGFFDHNRRVRAQRFRGEKSDGLWMPLRSLNWAGGDPLTLQEGDSFSEFSSHGICSKYYTPATLRALRGGTPRTRREHPSFPKHDDTKQFRFVADLIPDDAVVYVTEKLHGTSGRFGRVWDSLDLPRWKELLNHISCWLGFEPWFDYKFQWVYLNGSKNVILDTAKDTGGGWYGTNDFRHKAVEGLSLAKGEVLYFEIVGWVAPARPVMPAHDVSSTNLKDIRRQYGDTMHYTYGCPNGLSKLYVYKILNVNPDGVSRELSFPQMVARCGELGVAHVPLLAGPYTLGHLAYTWELPGKEALRKTVEIYTEGSSTLDHTQIREGVVVRVESTSGTSHIKNKQWAFGVLEGFWKEQDDSVDLEEVS